MSEHDYTDEHVEDEARAAGEQRRAELPGLGYADKFPAPDAEAPVEGEDVDVEGNDDDEGAGEEDGSTPDSSPAPGQHAAPAPSRQPWTLGQGE